MLTAPAAHPDHTRPAKLDPHEKMRIRAAAYRATQLYPGVVGKLIADELAAVEDFGYRFGNGGRTAQLLQHVLTAPLPDQPRAA